MKRQSSIVNSSRNALWFAASVMFILMATLSLGQIDKNAHIQGESENDIPPRPALDTQGDGDGYGYDQVPSASNVYAVTFPDEEIVLVSDSFLSLVSGSGMDQETQEMALRQYPAMVEDNFGSIMESTFPVEGETPALPFESVECESTDGSYMTVDQDDMASPYVRIMVKDKNGQMESFSLNRQFIEGLLDREETDGDKLISSATSFPFRLPESTRPGFRYLTREQMDDIALNLPSLQNQEIIRMPRFYREQAEEVLKEFSNRPPRVIKAVDKTAKIQESTSAGAREPGRRKSIRTTAPPSEKASPVTKAANEPAPEAGKRKLNWPALAGWVVAALALIWAITRRKG